MNIMEKIELFGRRYAVKADKAAAEASDLAKRIDETPRRYVAGGFGPGRIDQVQAALREERADKLDEARRYRAISEEATRRGRVLADPTECRRGWRGDPAAAELFRAAMREGLVEWPDRAKPGQVPVGD